MVMIHRKVLVQGRGYGKNTEEIFKLYQTK